MAAAGVLVLIGYAVGAHDRARRPSSDPDARAAAAGVWDAFLGDLRTAGWVLAGAGAIVAAAAESLIRPVAIESRLRALWRIATTEPVAVPLRLARASALVVARPAADRASAARAAGRRDGGRRLRRLQGHRGAAAAGLSAAAAEPAAAPEAEPPRRRRSRLAAVVAIAALLVVADRHRLRGRRRRRRAGAADLALQRPRRAVRPPARRGRARRDAQLDVGAAAGVDLGRAGPPDRRPARGRDPRTPARHPLRRPARQRPRPHVLRERRGPAARDRAGQRFAGQRRGSPAPARPPRVPRRGHPRHVPVPHLLRARRHAAGGRARRTSTTSSRPTRRGRRHGQPGLRHARGLRRGDRRRRPHALRLHAAQRVAVADAAGDDRGRPAARDAGREPRRRRALVPARLRAPDRGDAVRLRLRGGADRRGGPGGRLPPEPRPARARRCSSSTTG